MNSPGGSSDSIKKYIFIAKLFSIGKIESMTNFSPEINLAYFGANRNKIFHRIRTVWIETDPSSQISVLIRTQIPNRFNPYHIWDLNLSIFTPFDYIQSCMLFYRLHMLYFLPYVVLKSPNNYNRLMTTAKVREICLFGGE